MMTINIYRDNKVIKTFNEVDNDFCALRWLLSNQGNSCDHAIRYEGYKVELIDNDTNKIQYWKHSGNYNK